MSVRRNLTVVLEDVDKDGSEITVERLNPSDEHEGRPILQFSGNPTNATLDDAAAFARAVLDLVEFVREQTEDPEDDE